MYIYSKYKSKCHNAQRCSICSCLTPLHACQALQIASRPACHTLAPHTSNRIIHAHCFALLCSRVYEYRVFFCGGYSSVVCVERACVWKRARRWQEQEQCKETGKEQAKEQDKRGQAREVPKGLWPHEKLLGIQWVSNPSTENQRISTPPHSNGYK